MDLSVAVKGYIDKIIASVPDMKVLLLDDDTKNYVSLVYSQSSILEKQVYLVDTIGKSKEKMPHLKALVFIRPTAKSIRALEEEFADPHFGSYHIYFSNVIPGDTVRALADADDKELAREVHEYYFDYIVLENQLYTLRLENSLCLNKARSKWNAAEEGLFLRCVGGVISVLLSLKKRPVIRYSKASDLASSFAREVKYSIDKEDSKGDGLFDFRKDGTPPLLLVLDRRDDPITPLLSQWTYQAMVHEVIGIDLNKVDLTTAKTDVKGDKEVVLSSEFDSFYKTNMFANFGEMGVAIKDMLELYAKKTSNSSSVNSIDDMKKFVENYPEMKKLSNNVSKHVTLMSELAKAVEDRSLMEVSALEQDMACSSDHANQSKSLMEKLINPRVSNKDALKLVMIYALRYESYGGNMTKKAMSTLAERGVPRHEIALIDELLAYAGEKVRGSELFGDQSAMSRVIGGLKKEIAGVSNVYTQHKPLLLETLDLIKRGKLKDTNYPYEGRGISSPPQDVIIFMLGGCTYEEYLTVNEVNKAGGMRVILGGTCMHNSESFIREISMINNSMPERRMSKERGMGFGTDKGVELSSYAKLTSV